MATVVKAAMLIDGTGREPTMRPSVVIDGGRFVRIAAGEAPDLPSDAQVIDVGSAILLPGLIDCHEHLGPREELGYWRRQMQDPDVEIAFRMVKSAKEAIEGGVTSARMLGDKNGLDLVAKKYIDTGYIVGPRVYPSLAGIRSAHGHGATATTNADGVDAVRKAVRETVFKGAHHIKIFITGGIGTIGTDPRTTYYTREEIHVAIEESHNVNKKIATHCYGGKGADWAIEAGMDCIEHGAYLTEEQIAAMAKQGIFHDPTTIAYFHERPESHERPAEVIAKGEQAREFSAQNVRRGKEAGLKIVTGTDGWHGEVWHEMGLLVRFGRSPMEAIMAATRNGAELLGELDQIGTVEVGKLADLIAVKGDPLADISAMKDVCLVMRDGMRYV